MVIDVPTTSSSEIKMNNFVENYYHALGGKEFPKETTDRLKRFFAELIVKREYKKFTTFPTNNDQMIIVNKIRIFSFCEHHLLPFFGYVSVGYIPDGLIMGLSKFQRIVDKIASKPTLQENVTQEIADKVKEILNPKGLGVSLNCQHTCMFGRGVERPEINVSSQVLLGAFKNTETRHEFFMRIRE